MSEALARPLAPARPFLRYVDGRAITREKAARVRVLRFMDGQGHTSFGWDPEDDHWVLPMIREKMEQGYVFWVVRRPEPLRRLQEVQLERVEDIGETRNIIIRDDASRRLFEQGRIALFSDSDDEDLERVRRATSAEDVVANDTIASRPFGRG